MANEMLKSLVFFPDMSFDVPRFKVRVFASDLEFWIGENEH